MMIGIPLLIGLVPGLIVLLLTWLFRRMKWRLPVRMIPAILTVIASIVLFYIGYVEVRGFEGAAYLFLAVFLILFAVISFVMAKKPLR
jgi:ABC-type nickel/cobalt efflux system permease component RcnA